MARAILWLTLGFMLVVAGPAERTSSVNIPESTSTQSSLSTAPSSLDLPSTPEVNASLGSIVTSNTGTTSDSTSSSTSPTTTTPLSTSSSTSSTATTPLSSSPTQTTASSITPLSSPPAQTTASASTASSSSVLQSSQAHHGTPPGTVALAVVLSIIGCIFLFAILRCCNSYRKTPHYDRVAAAINRHLIYREMTEDNQRPMVDENMSTKSLPRYSPRPPSFASRESDNPFDDSHNSPSRPVSSATSSAHSSPFSDDHARESHVSTHSLHSDTVSVYSTRTPSFSVSPFSDPAPQRTSYE